MVNSTRTTSQCKTVMVMKMIWMTMECTMLRMTLRIWSHHSMLLVVKTIHQVLCFKDNPKWEWVWVLVVVLIQPVVCHSMDNKINHLLQDQVDLPMVVSVVVPVVSWEV